MGHQDEEPRVFRLGGVSYLEVPSPDPAGLAAFYAAVFSWRIRPDDSPAFEDGSGHVIGHFVRGLPVAGDAGFVPYVYVESVADAVDRVRANGGAVVRDPYPEGDLLVAVVHDPAGNRLGIWQQG